MMSAVQAIEDANKEIHHGELADVLPDQPPPLPPPTTLQIPHPLHHQQLQTSQTSHHHQQQQGSHHQQQQNHQSATAGMQSQHEPISPHHPHHPPAISPHHPHAISPHHPHQQPTISPHHPHQQQPAISPHQLHHSLQTQHSLGSQSLVSHPSSSSTPLHLHSQGVNTSNIGPDVASSSQRPHLCPTCLKGFRTKGQLTQHTLVHTNIRKHICIYCDRAFKQLSHLQQHTRIHTGKLYGSEPQRSHICETCLKGFFTKQQLAQHTVVHTNIRKYICVYCERAFKQLSHLQQHTRIHTERGETDKREDRRYLCHFCDRAFKQLTHLQQHTRLHTGEKPYICTFEGCDRAFVQMSNLQHHIRNHEEQVKKQASRIHRCLICHRAYTNESSLRAHTLKMHIHINKLPQDGQGFDSQLMKKHRKKKHRLYNAPTMVPVPSHGQAMDKKMMSDSSSDDDLIIIGEKRQQDFPSGMGGIPRSLVESLNHYERTFTSGMGGRKLQDGNISSSNQLGGQQLGGTRTAANLASLMGLPGIDPVLMSSQPPEVIERAVAAAAAAVSNQLLQNSGGGNNTSSSTSSTNSTTPNNAQNNNSSNNTQSHPQPAHSQLANPKANTNTTTNSSNNNNAGGSSNTNTTEDNNPSRAATCSPQPHLQPLTPLDMMGMGGAGYAPHKPYSQIMDAHLRSQMTPISLPPVPDQYFAHGGPPLGMLSHHARFLPPTRSMADLPMSYGSQISSAPSTVTGSHISLPSLPHGNS